jgi:hypothetical protein
MKKGSNFALVPGSPFQAVLYMVYYLRRDGRVVYCGCLENSWVNSPRGSNPFPSVARVVRALCIDVCVPTLLMPDFHLSQHC